MKSIVVLVMLVFLSACVTNQSPIEKEKEPFMQWSKVKELIESGHVVKIYELNSEYLTLQTGTGKRFDFVPPSTDEVNKALFLAPNRDSITWYYQ